MLRSCIVIYRIFIILYIVIKRVFVILLLLIGLIGVPLLLSENVHADTNTSLYLSLTSILTGGYLSANSYSYEVTSTSNSLESNFVAVTNTGSMSTNVLSWRKKLLEVKREELPLLLQ